MAITLDTVAVNGTQKTDIAALTNGAQRIAGLVNAIVANTNATFSQAKTFVDALEVEQTAQGGRIGVLETLVNSSDTALDTLQEIVDFIKINRTTLDALTVGSIAGLQGALDTLQGNIDSLRSDMEGEITRVEGLIGDNASEITAIKNGGFVLTAASLGTDADWGLV